jgi:hypothetical protein
MKDKENGKMFNKSFNEMMAIDVTPYVKQRDGMDYLGWAICKKLLHDNGAEEVIFYPIPATDGSTLRMSTATFVDKNGMANRVYEVLVHIKVDDIEWDIAYPVLNGNNPGKDNSMSQLRVHNAVRRAFVKGVAERIGLGFSLWLDDDDLQQEETDDLSKHNILKIKQRVQELITAKINQGLSLQVIADRLGMDEEGVRAKFAVYNELYNFEGRIWEMKP